MFEGYAVVYHIAKAKPEKLVVNRVETAGRRLSFPTHTHTYLSIYTRVCVCVYRREDFYFHEKFSSLGELGLSRRVRRRAAFPPGSICVCVCVCVYVRVGCVSLPPLTANFRHFGPAEWRAPRPRLGGVSCGCRPPQPSQPPAARVQFNSHFFTVISLPS